MHIFHISVVVSNCHTILCYALLSLLHKVTVVDGPQGTAVVKNLSILSVNNEEAAQTMLAQGNIFLA